MLLACFLLFFMFLGINTYLLLMIYHIPVSSCDVVSNAANPLVVWNSTLYNAKFKLSDASTIHGRFYARGDDLYSANLTGCVVIALLAIFAILAIAVYSDKRDKRSMKKLLTVFLCLISITLTGCGVEQIPYNGSTSVLELPVSDTTVVRLNIPDELECNFNDSIIGRKYSDGTVIEACSVDYHEGKLDEETKVKSGKLVNTYWVNKQFEDKVILITFENKAYIDYWKNVLATAEIVKVQTTLANIPIIDELSYESKEDIMQVNDVNLYMPSSSGEETLNKSTINGLTASIVSEGDSYLLAFIQDGTYEEIKERMLTYCIANSKQNSIDKYYPEDKQGISVYYSGDNILGMKKLTHNSYYVYLGSLDYKDFIYTGLHKVKLKS